MSGSPQEEVVLMLSSLSDSLSEAATEADYQDRQKGKRFEKHFKELAREKGLAVSPRVSSQHDCVVNGLRVECKQMDAAHCYLTAVPVLGRDYRGYEAGDWDVLAMSRNGVLVIIPAKLLTDPITGRIANHLKFGDWISWKDRWDVFGEGFETQSHSQLSLF